MSTTNISVQPLDLGSTLHKVNFGLERFALTGYTTRADIFTYEQGKNRINKPFNGGGISEKELADNSLCAARFVYSLEYLGSDADPEHDLLAIMQELYRICCDGALIEVHCAGEGAAVRHGDPLQKRRLSAKTWPFFDADARKTNKDPISGKAWAEDERMAMVLEAIEQTGVNFKLCHLQHQVSEQVINQIKANNIQSQQQIQKIIEQVPQSILSSTFYLVCVKDPSHSFAVAHPNMVAPFSMRLYANESEDIYISKAIRLVGAWEPQESLIVSNLCKHMLEMEPYKDGFKLANIGANIGWYCLLLGHLSSKIHIDAFEPTPQTLEILSQNLKINGLNEQVTVFPCAMSDSVESCELFLNEHNAGGNSLKMVEEDHDFSHEHTITIQTETLERLYGDLPQSEWPNFIIIDTEGHEQKVWNGAQKLFDQGWRPVVLTEFAPQLLVLRGECTYYKQWIQDYHYQVYAIARANNQASLIAESLEALQQQFDQLKENNTEGVYLDLLFVPEHMAIKDGKLTLK